jgi:dolichol-phosphate mannosyltransferase
VLFLNPAPRRLMGGRARYSLLVLGALAVVALSRLVWIGRPTLLPDEAYYWEWSRRLDLGYFDHPPLVALVIHATTALAGVSEFAVRVGMVALGVGTVALAYRAGVLLGGRLAGWFCLVAAATCPLFVLLSGFAAPDGPLLFLWAATVYSLLLAVTRGRARYWYAAGILLGLALLAKYVAAVLVPSVLLFLLLSRGGWLRRREPYIAGGLALLVFSPDIWWNLRHGWVSMTFQLAHGACQAGSSATDHLHAAFVYVVTQISIVGPLLALLLVAGTIAALIRGVRRRQESPLLLACCTLVISALFFAVHGLAHWAAPAYFSAIICGGVFLARLLRRVSARKRVMLAAACIIALLATALESAYVVHTVAEGAAMSGPLGEMIEPTLVEPALRWREVGHDVSAELAGLRTEKSRPPVVLADSYGTAAEVAFYTAGHPRVYSASNEYRLWGPPPPAATRGDVLFVGNQGVLAATPPSLRRGERVAATMTVRAGGHVVRRLELAVLPAPSPSVGPAAVGNLLTAAWRAAATLCEGS